MLLDDPSPMLRCGSHPRAVVGILCVLLWMLPLAAGAQRIIIPLFEPLDERGRRNPEAGWIDRELRLRGEVIHRRWTRQQRIGDHAIRMISVREVRKSFIETLAPYTPQIGIDVRIWGRPPHDSEGPRAPYVHFHQFYHGGQVTTADDPARALLDLLERTPDRWTCVLFDGEVYYHWASDPQFGADYAPQAGNPVVDLADGFPIFPAGRRSAPSWKPLSLLAVLTIAEDPVIEGLMRFLRHARVSEAFRWEVRQEGGGRDVLVVWHDLAQMLRLGGHPPDRRASLTIELDLATGWAKTISQEMETVGKDRSESTRVVSFATREVGAEGVTYDFPYAIQDLMVGYSPRWESPRPDGRVVVVDEGMRESITTTLVLELEVDPPDIDEHPAFAPDTLASWLGVPLRWRNGTDATVTSVPARPVDQLHHVRNAELERIARMLRAGELEVTIPFDYQGAEELWREVSEGEAASAAPAAP